MPVKIDPDVEALRLQSEINRAALASSVRDLKGKVGDTVDEFRERVSPAHIKQEIREYVREGSQSFVQSLEQKARDNPLQAVAVGAAIAYPLLGMLRTIPAPLMLVGAGLWFAGKSGRKTLSKVKAKAADIAGQTSEDIAGFAGSARQTASYTADRMSQTVSGQSAAVAGRVGDVADQLRTTVQGLEESATELGKSLLDSTVAGASAATDTVTGVASDVKNRVVAAGTQSRDTVLDFVDRNPLLVGGVGLTIGVFIASSLPKSDVENRFLGEHSDDLKQRARTLAADGIDHARGVATGVAGEMAMAAAREGLSSDSVKNVVEGVTQRVAAVANRGLNTALGEKHLWHPPLRRRPTKLMERTMSDAYRPQGNMQNSAGSDASLADKAKSIGREFKDQASGLSDSVARTAKDQASGIADAAKDFASTASGKVSSALNDQKAAGADYIGSIAQAVKRAAGEFEGDVPQAATYIRQTAERIDNVATAVRDRDMRELVGEVKDFARRQPTLFFGGAMVLSFAALRFFKSTANDGTGSAQQNYSGGGSSPAPQNQNYNPRQAN